MLEEKKAIQNEFVGESVHSLDIVDECSIRQGEGGKVKQKKE